MNVWFVASEGVPLVKTGGLADVIGALPKALAGRGVDVTVVLPKYGSIPGAYLENAVFKGYYYITMGWRREYCGLFEVLADGVRFLLVDNEFYFRRESPYGYGDDAERFVFFSFAAVEAMLRETTLPDVVHCHDWQAGLVPFLLRTRYAYEPAVQRVRTVFTIHNLQYQGVFSRELLQDLLSVGDDAFTGDSLEFYGAASCMKAGLRFSDKLTTVSPSYALEIQTEAYGEKLDGVLRQRAGDLVGILNGIDTDSYDSMKDPALPVRYRDSLAKKRLNKPALQRELGLAEDAEAPLIGVVSRMVGQKGFDLILDSLDGIMAEGAQLAILGSGDPHFEHLLGEAIHRYPGRLAVWFGFNEGLARRIYAASDMFLMPSRFEPCGLSQLISLRYRTVPIVRETGGLKDTVEAYNEFAGTGNGFSFGPATAHDLLHTVRRALHFYREDPEAWKRIVNNGAKRDYGWGSSAKQYELLYRELVK